MKPEYGYLWWLNDDGIPWPGAPTTGAQGAATAGGTCCGVDPARELVLASHWTEDPLALIRATSAAVRINEG